MAKVSIHQDLLLHLLYGAPDGRRYTQDTPVLPDVWLHFARDVCNPVKGLIVPRNDHQAHHVANELHERLRNYRSRATLLDIAGRESAGVSDMPGLIALQCHFDEVVNVIMPLTRWWVASGMEELVKLPEAEIAAFAAQAFQHLQAIEASAIGGGSFGRRDVGGILGGNLGRYFDIPVSIAKGRKAKPGQVFPDSAARVLLVFALIHAANLNLLGGADDNEKDVVLGIGDLPRIDAATIGTALTSLLQLKVLRERRLPLSGHFKDQLDQQRKRKKGDQVSGLAQKDATVTQAHGFDPRLIFTFSINREGDGAVLDSVKTTKADAARRLFALTNGRITWAVIDSGIDAEHHAFRKYPTDHVFGPVKDWDKLEEPVPRDASRVVARYDMTLVSDLRNRDSLLDDSARDALAERISKGIDLPGDAEDDPDLMNDVHTLLSRARDDLDDRKPLNWDLVEQIARIRHDRTPTRDHGTHVAGTLGGRWPETASGSDTVWVEGMCPDINLMDFNVIGDSAKATEFAVIAALRLIRHLNERNDFKVVHGANLSLSIPHDVTNYACGRTPVCVECETLVNNGVVVVAAAGNAGYNIFKTKDRDLPLHTDTSITDPGNAEAVITVGSTHRLEPHNYGVSYFSSRGPTGDGRMKPDLVAPGEKIDGPICSQQFATLEGTSMAAPHVSGAAAHLMARFPELIGNPRRIKQILCDSATDLGRERAYQGRGLVDVLRALQSV